MKIQSGISLKPYNTFGIAARAERFAILRSEEDLRTILRANIAPLHLLGGGSNVLLTKDLPGLVLRNELKGIHVEKETETEVIISAGAGELWHELVLWSLAHNFGGLENLSLIPGTVGAAPIQNIGAYGAELKDVFEKLEACDLERGERRIFRAEDCRFGYRNSIFKNELKGRCLITRVWLRLSKSPTLNLSYRILADSLRNKGITDPGVCEVSETVIAIRQSKLPDPARIGNAGSFFKNPEVPVQLYQSLKENYPDLPAFPLPGNDGQVKLAAAWLIEKAGWKGRRIGDAGVHEKQALVLVNYGNASGIDILNLAREIQHDILEKFAIDLQPEVNIW